MEGFPAGLVEALASERQADLARRLRGRARPETGARRPGEARTTRPGHRPALARRMGRLLVLAGIRLAGPDARRAWAPLADATR